MKLDNNNLRIGETVFYYEDGKIYEAQIEKFDTNFITDEVKITTTRTYNTSQIFFSSYKEAKAACIEKITNEIKQLAQKLEQLN